MRAISDLELKSNQEEILPGYTEAFPYVCMFRRMDECIGRKIAWHWHSALEIDYVEEGELEYKTPENPLLLHKGEAVFFNSDVLHTVTAGTAGYMHIYLTEISLQECLEVFLNGNILCRFWKISGRECM